MYTNHILGKHNLMENEKVLLAYRKTAQENIHVNHEVILLYDVDMLNVFPEQKYSPNENRLTDERTNGRQVS